MRFKKNQQLNERPGADLVLSLDIGSSSVKAAIFDTANGGIVSHASRKVVGTEEVDRVEIDLAEVTRASEAAASQCVRQCTSGRVEAIVVTGAGDGLVLLGADSEPLGKGISSADTRAAYIVQKWKRQGISQELSHLIGEVPFSGTPLALLSWLVENDQSRYHHARHLLFLKDWVRFQLTGDLSTDPTDGSATLLDLSGQANKEIFRIAGVPGAERLVPVVRSSDEVSGGLAGGIASRIGLPEGTPVYTGIHDCTASSLGTGMIGEGDVTLISGTWSGNQSVLHEAKADSPLEDRWILRRFAIPGYWLAITASPTGMNNVAWFMESFSRSMRHLMPDTEEVAGLEEKPVGQSRGLYDDIDKVLAEVRDDELPLFHPFLHGSRRDASVGAAFSLIRPHHNAKHFLRAIYESLAFNHADHVSDLSAATEPARHALCGGGSRSREFVQLVADVVGTEIAWTSGEMTTARGGAIVASYGMGVHKSYVDATNALVPEPTSVLPNKQRLDVLGERYETYKRLNNCLFG